MDLSPANPKRSSALVYINMGMWALAVAIILRLWRTGDWHFWRGFTKSDPATTEKASINPLDSTQEVEPDEVGDGRHRNAAFRQASAEQSIVMDITDFDADPALAVYDVEIRRRPRHHHHL